ISFAPHSFGFSPPGWFVCFGLLFFYQEAFLLATPTLHHYRNASKRLYLFLFFSLLRQSYFNYSLFRVLREEALSLFSWEPVGFGPVKAYYSSSLKPKNVTMWAYNLSR
ncbi:hypothetical protein, partial [Moorella stamsii (nom. illeg.)]|uniref:hypothetical protein n=1 Tax=Neomoorella stamsii TaxID=1266720 RepID=UPI001B800558